MLNNIDNENCTEKIFTDKYKETNLENQIEVMLDEIMDVENENDNLNFSDDDSFMNSEITNDKETNQNNKIDGRSIFSFALNDSTYSEEQERVLENVTYNRKNKKFQTVCFNKNIPQNNQCTISKLEHNNNRANTCLNNNNYMQNNINNFQLPLMNQNLVENNNINNCNNNVNSNANAGYGNILLYTNQYPSQNSLLNTNNNNMNLNLKNNKVSNNSLILNNNLNLSFNNSGLMYNNMNYPVQRNMKRKNTVELENINFNYIDKIKSSINMNACINQNKYITLLNNNQIQNINNQNFNSVNNNANLNLNLCNSQNFESVLNHQYQNSANINSINNINSLNTNLNNINSHNNIKNINNFLQFSNENTLFSSPQKLRRKGNQLSNTLVKSTNTLSKNIILNSLNPVANSNINSSNINSNTNQSSNNNIINLMNTTTPNQNLILKEKKFCTMTYPKGTNMQLELLIYELNNTLRKIEKIDYYMYNKIQGNFINIIKTHNGSKLFQNYLKNTHSDIIHQIFSEINVHLSDLISDSYANYFCKRFFCFLSQKDRIDFLISIQPSLVKLSIDKIGTYPIQSIIEQVGSKVEKKIIISSLQNSIAELCINTYGCHILEKIISYFEDEFTTIIYDYVSNNFINLANNINGICVVKKVLTLTHKKELHEKLKKLSLENASSLIQHCYGNYVIQVIVENWDLSEINEIINEFKGNFVYLSMQKYSSNVVERCIEKCEDIYNLYIEEICQSDRISEIMKNNFGNYVIQKALKLSNGKNRSQLSNIVNKNISKINDKKLISKWKSIVSPYLENNNNENSYNDDDPPKENNSNNISSEI